MGSKSLNTRVSGYKKVFASGEVQQTYQELVGLVQSLRTEFAKKYIHEFSVAKILHGYIDFTYFYLENEYLKKNHLKLAVVFTHRHAKFELWLLGRTKEVQTRYWQKLRGVKWVREDAMPEYSVLEVTLLANPDFDNQTKLFQSLHAQFRTLSQEILGTLKAYA